MPTRMIRGKILYTSRKVGRRGHERGREHFIWTVHGDGSRTVRALCEIDEPAPTVLRDVTCTFDSADRPTDAFVRVSLDDRFVGAGLFQITAGWVECESFGPPIGRVSQRSQVDRPFAGLGMHPISSDAYIVKEMLGSKGESRVLRCLVPSPDHRGAGPPLIGWSEMRCDHIADETITVGAGTFESSHFRFTDPVAQAHPDYDIWVTADDDVLFLQGGVGGYMQSWYELMELDRVCPS